MVEKSELLQDGETIDLIWQNTGQGKLKLISAAFVGNVQDEQESKILETRESLLESRDDEKRSYTHHTTKN